MKCADANPTCCRFETSISTYFNHYVAFPEKHLLKPNERNYACKHIALNNGPSESIFLLGVKMFSL